MSRLYRPHIPLEVRCRVALRQLGEMWIDDAIAAWGNIGYGNLLATKLVDLAKLLHCEVSDLRLDHDPPLAARPQERRGLGKKTYYLPDANDPEYLFYRPHGAQFAGSHDVKTRIRGDHGQFSDIALIKRQRRRERGPKPKRGPKLQGRGFSKPATKRKWASRPFNRR